MNFAKNYLKKVDWKKTGYWATYIIPALPTYYLIKELTKPKEKRNKFIITAGASGTLILLTKIVLTYGTTKGISSFFDRDQKENTKIEQQEKINNLEKKIYIEDKSFESN